MAATLPLVSGCSSVVWTGGGVKAPLGGGCRHSVPAPNPSFDTEGCQNPTRVSIGAACVRDDSRLSTGVHRFEIVEGNRRRANTDGGTYVSGAFGSSGAGFETGTSGLSHL